jgi:transcriptional regulator with XRE-family HTH domain
MGKPSHSDPLLERLRAKRELPLPAERRRIREAAGASLRDIASELGVSHTAVRRWETSRAVPRESRIAYARLLDELKRLTG